MPKRNQHVVPHDGRWAVRREGSNRVTSKHDTQREAIEAAREILRNQGGELFIHGRNGYIRAKDSYGTDPNPPRDRALTPERPSSRQVDESLEIIEDQGLDEEIRRAARSSGYQEEDSVDIVRRYRAEKNSQRAAS